MSLKNIEQNKLFSKEKKGIYIVGVDSLEEKIPAIVYNVDFDYSQGQYYLKSSPSDLSVNHKVYDLQDSFIERCVHIYNSTKDNMGVLLNGVKGTGKTVTAKLIAKKLGLPVLVINDDFDADNKFSLFLSALPQNFVFFLDEYEKVFEGSSELLSLMDGVSSSSFRRFFLLTTNEKRVDANLIQRPGRIRYIKEFGNLPQKVVEEILDDCLFDKSKKKTCVDFIMSLKLITVDIVTKVAEEVNLTNELPEDFEEFFNVQRK